MSTSYFNPAFENQYLESNGFEGEILEDREFGNPEGISLEGMSMEYGSPEASMEYGELGEYGEFGELGEVAEYGEFGEVGEYGEYEGGSMEGDRFFGALGSLLGKIAPQIAQAVGGALAGETGAGIAQEIAENVLNEQQMEYNGEFSGEHEGQLEAILEASGVNMEILGEMAHYAELAAEATNEQEADRFFGAIANLAGSLLPQLLGESQMEVSPESIANEAIFEDEGDRFLPLLAAAAPMIGKVAGPLLKKALPLATRGIKSVVKKMGKLTRRLPAKERKVVTRLVPAIAAKTAVRTANAVKKMARRQPPQRRVGRRGNARVMRPNNGYKRPYAQPVRGYRGSPVPVTQTFASAPMPINQVVAGAAARPVVETLVSPARRDYALRRNRAWANQFNVKGTFTVSRVR